MNEPVSSKESPTLRALPPDEPALDEQQSQCIAGGGGPPPAETDSTVGFWMLFFFGMILVALSLLALSKDPAAAAYYQHVSWLGGLRVNIEQGVLVVGGACAFTALAILRARFVAKKVEHGSQGKVKSFRAKRLEKLSDSDVFTIIARYVGSFLR